MRYDPAVVSAFAATNDNERIGAISVLNALGRELPDDEDGIKKEWIITSWFADETTAAVKNAALNYLGRNGTAEDLTVAKAEYDRSDYGTSRSALECMIRILLRTGMKTETQELVLNSQFDSLDTATLHLALDGFERLEVEQLQLGLEHRNVDVRLKSLRLLIARGCLDSDAAERLTRDSDAFIRNEALSTLLERGRPFSEEEIRSILAPLQKEVRAASILFGPLGKPDKKGEEIFERYQMMGLMQRSEAETHAHG